MVWVFLFDFTGFFSDRGSWEDFQPLSALGTTSAPRVTALTHHPVLISSRWPLKHCLLVLSPLGLQHADGRRPAIRFPALVAPCITQAGLLPPGPRPRGAGTPPASCSLCDPREPDPSVVQCSSPGLQLQRRSTTPGQSATIHKPKITRPPAKQSLQRPAGCTGAGRLHTALENKDGGSRSGECGEQKRSV